MPEDCWIWIAPFATAKAKVVLALPSGVVLAQTPLHPGKVGVRGARLAQMRVQGVACGIERVVVLLERLLGRLFARRPTRGAPLLGVLVAAVLSDGVCTARVDVEAACAVAARA